MNITKLIAKPLLALLFVTLSLHANAQHFKVKKIKDVVGDSELEFLALTGTTVAENQINTYLQGKELEILPGKQKHDIFENIRPKTGSTTGITQLNYTVLVNNSKLFSVEVNNEYTSASLNEYSTTYNFDAQTGKLIQFSDLVTKEGYQAIRKFVIKSRKTKLSSHLKALKNSGEKESSTIDTYSGCLLEEDKDNLDPDDLKFQKTGLHLTRRSCSGSHYFQAFEEKINIYKNLLSIKFLEPYLNEYGKCLLAVPNTKCTYTNPAASLHLGVFKGKINQLYPITLLVTYLDKDSFQASYFYDKQGKEIRLSGSFDKDSSLLLKEAPSYEENAKKKQEFFKLKVQADGSLAGSWNDGKNSYPVQLK
ncbi:hypothetical protein H7F33_02240 [Pedobacter sp. PAMC26386]|nr:hypothetical protein H7F33_02240 [Pedobacter sp. PAMC26386]